MSAVQPSCWLPTLVCESRFAVICLKSEYSMSQSIEFHALFNLMMKVSREVEIF